MTRVTKMARKTHVESSGFNVTPLIPKSKQHVSAPSPVAASPPSSTKLPGVKEEKATTGKRKRKADAKDVAEAGGGEGDLNGGQSAGGGIGKPNSQIELNAGEAGDVGTEEGGGDGGDQESQPKKKKMRHRSKLDPSERKTAKDDAAADDYLSKKERDSLKRRTRKQKLKERKMTCFLCRKQGHSIKFCPSAPSSEDTPALTMEDGCEGSLVSGGAVEGICYRCGSLEHRLAQCKKKTDSRNYHFCFLVWLDSPRKDNQIPRNTTGNPLPFASCFICNQKGHLSSQCPENERGLYPNGGGCKFCGSVRHLARDCKPAQQEAGFTTLGKMDLAQGGDDDDVFVALKKMQESKADRCGSGSSGKAAMGDQRVEMAAASGETRAGTSASRVKPKKKVVSF
ncbi:hypothetical protein HK097_002245 [Rhizophlyctis rosea]|uniref:CCHC-type domain-containing protein n=1 Tax=Rhizophlyctis rosea TaxID=64517 RepID=A0AAD5X6L2_9FUNG|nr:hypothetical protein HK097_002245 [Rhizophlyctis rosea]